MTSSAHVWDATGNDRATVASEAALKVHYRSAPTPERFSQRPAQDLEEPYTVRYRRLRWLLKPEIPKRAIVDLVEEHEVDLVITSTVNRTGTAGLPIATAAETVLGAVTRGVLAVEPGGPREIGDTWLDHNGPRRTAVYPFAGPQFMGSSITLECVRRSGFSGK